MVMSSQPKPAPLEPPRQPGPDAGAPGTQLPSVSLLIGLAMALILLYQIFWISKVTVDVGVVLTAIPTVAVAGMSKSPCSANKPLYLSNSPLLISIWYDAPSTTPGLTSPWMPNLAPKPVELSYPLLLKLEESVEKPPKFERPVALNR